jgi:hypothetical protein
MGHKGVASQETNQHDGRIPATPGQRAPASFLRADWLYVSDRVSPRVGNRPRGPSEAVHSARRYRSKLEILREILQAAREPRGRTQIAGLANINMASLDRYSVFWLEHGLLPQDDGLIIASSRSLQLRAAVDVVLQKTNELSAARGSIDRVLNSRANLGSTEPTRSSSS